MTKSKGGRRQVRPVVQSSVSKKRFKRVAETSKRAVLGKVQPLVVLADLRNGSLSSLTRYLAQEGGISDRAVAIELRKLISGSASRSKYRLLVVDHPDRPKDLGGRPSEPVERSLSQYRQMVARYEEALPLERGKKHLARAFVATEFKCSDPTVKRAIRIIREEQLNVRKAASERQAALENLQNRDTALSALRKERKSS